MATSSSSSSTIYDYPEHLNPFYEDENHKRLRFWHHKPAGYKSQRRGSLSSLREGLRDLWQFSSIRFGKKRSSTLGINKTSESPPPLRREPYDVDGGSASFSGYRNTVSTPGNGNVRGSQSYTTTPQFERQTRYRSSLQPRSQDNGDAAFTRNHRYRSTIQNGYNTYNGAMVTSTPRKRQAPPQPYGTTPRVPQQHNNSNPFDDEVELNGDNVSTYSYDSTYTISSMRTGTRTRTKRRAPPPPPVAVKPAQRKNVETEESEVQSEDLRNLTAEIASFVSSATGGDETSRVENVAPATPTTEEATRDPTHDVNNNNRSSEIPTTVSSIEIEIVQEDRAVSSAPKEPATNHVTPSVTENAALKTTNVTTDERREIVESKNVPYEDTKPLNNEPAPKRDTTVNTTVVETVVETVNIRTSPTPVPRKQSHKQITQTVCETESAQKHDIDFENLALPETPVPTRRLSREKRAAEEKPTPATKPVADTVDLQPTTMQAIEPQDNDDDGPTTTIIVDNLHYKLKVAPIQTEINSKLENARMKISESTGNITMNVTENGTTDRRRSVKDIIESINKSQSMLKVNAEPSRLHDAQSTDSMSRDIRELYEREKEIQNMLQDISPRYPVNDGGSSSGAPVVPTGRGSYYDNLADDNFNDNLDDKNNMYATSGHRVKKSPTKTVIIAQGDDQFQDCIDWNPLPKPRRSQVMGENVTGASPTRSEVARTTESAPS